MAERQSELVGELYWFSVTAGFDVVLIAWLACARYREALFTSWDKTDPKDAHVLLELLKQDVTMRYVDPLVAYSVRSSIGTLPVKDSRQSTSPTQFPEEPPPLTILRVGHSASS
ncbi:hypothetical protein BH11GEM2_BH11GEM2_07180 [soil metagenome]